MDLTFPALQALEMRILNTWAHMKPVIIQAGILSGKSSLAFSLGHKIGQMMVVAPTLEMARDPYERSGVVTHCLAAKSFDIAHLQKQGVLTTESYVVIDQCFDMTNGEVLFDSLTTLTPRVLAIGTAGEYVWGPDKEIWKYATWELNPLRTETELQQQAANPETFYRDYGK